MLNETISSLSNVDVIYPLAALITILAGIIAIFKVLLPYLKSKKEFSDLFLYCKAKDLQQEDFGIQPPSDAKANIEAYWDRDSDEGIEKPLEAHENVLVIGMPKMGKTRSVYQALKAALPDFYVIKVPPRKVEDFRLPFLRKNYLVFFDDLNEFVEVNFDFESFLKKFRTKSKNLIVVATCRSGDEYINVKKKSLQILRKFSKEINLDNYELDPSEGEKLADKAGIPWRPEQFLGTPGSVILDIEDMKNRYRSASDHEKCILRSCKLLKRANIFVYKKELIRAICDTVFETLLTEDSWIEAINHLSENSLVTKASIPRIDVYDPTLETIVYDYDPVYHLESLLTLLIQLKDAEDLFYLGNAFYNDRNYEKAEKIYKEYLRINPDDAEAHNNRGVLLANLEQYEEAETEYKEAIRINPDYAGARSNRGVLLAGLEQYEEAEREYKEAIRINPDAAKAHNNLGILLKKLERYEEAEMEYRGAIKINPDYADAYYNLGNLLKELERNEEAETEYKEAIRINPDDAGAHSDLGTLLRGLERYDKAEEELKEATKSNPDYAEAHGNLGILYAQTKRVEEAKKELETAKRLFEAQGRAEDVKIVEKLLKSL